MRFGTSLLARLRLEFSGIASRLVGLPLLGTYLRKLGNRLLPYGSLAWARIEEGPARGFWILLDARSAGDLRRGDREPGVQEILRQRLGPGEVFYDVGANAGFFALLAAKFGEGSAKIYAFEAAPDVVSRLKRTLERNAMAEVTVVEAAVWSETGEITFDRCLGSPDRMVGHVIEGSSEPLGDCVRVPAITLDEFARTAPAPDVVKCDVEGAEVEVFRGALGLLATKRPSVICEVHSPENLEELRSLFGHAGYQVSLLENESEFPMHILAEADR